MRGEHAWRAKARDRAKPPADEHPPTWADQVAERASPEWVQSVNRRVITALIAIPIVLAMVWFGGWVTFGGAFFIFGLGIYELHSIFHKIGYRPLTGFAFLVGTALLLSALFPAWRYLAIEVIVTALVLGSLSWLLIRRETGKALMDWALTLVMALYLAWPLSYLLNLRGSQLGYQITNHGFVAQGGANNLWWTLVALLGVWAFDSMAFFTGRFFGRHKLAPNISPNKTWEGVVGGTVLALVAAFIVTRPIAPAVAWYHVIVIGLLISFAATVGDLAESLIKRQADVKDSGGFFWGHGGVLDRIDSLLFAGMVIYFYVVLILHGVG